MIDFKKLMDPEEQRLAKVRRETEELAYAKKDEALRDKIDRCNDNFHVLKDAECSFIRSVRHDVIMHKLLSEKQEKYVDDIHKRLNNAPVVMGVTQGMRGWFAVCYRVHGDEAGPINTGIGSYRTAEDAYPEALEWAESEGIPILVNRRSGRSLGSEKKEDQAADKPVTEKVEMVKMAEFAVQEALETATEETTPAKRLPFKFRR